MPNEAYWLPAALKKTSHALILRRLWRNRAAIFPFSSATNPSQLCYYSNYVRHKSQTNDFCTSPPVGCWGFLEEYHVKLRDRGLTDTLWAFTYNVKVAKNLRILYELCSLFHLLGQWKINLTKFQSWGIYSRILSTVKGLGLIQLSNVAIKNRPLSPSCVDTNLFW